MRFIRIDSLKEDMVVGRSVFGTRGVLILREGNKLQSRHISALSELGYPGIYIFDKLSDGIMSDDLIDDEKRFSAIYMVKELYKSSGKGRNGKQMLAIYKEVESIVSEIVDSIFADDRAVVNVPLLRSYDEYTYRHSVDVSVMAVTLGKALKLSKDQLLDLAKAALFHDMGKMFVPITILNKPGRLDDEEMATMRKHAQFGHDFTWGTLNQKSLINRAVLHHHERWDGKGYPEGLKGNRIPIFSRIIAMADVFDAISSTRSYKAAQIATEGYEYIMANAGTHFDPELVEIFSKTIAPFPVGLTVKLSNGLSAVVTRNHASFMARPIIRMFDPKEPEVFEFIDLAHDPDFLSVTIVATE
ncbi:MAG: HD-GYP domain-containing protein [Defluviitaleaceae bacterium]|nr:HD-GYP domain-containing protein [Defluviitaleaceae bacterium]